MATTAALMSADDVEQAVAAMSATLRPLVDADWTVPAGGLEWSCWQTAAHMAHDLLAYAGQVTARTLEAYLPLDLVVRPDSTPAQLLDTIGDLVEVTQNHCTERPLPVGDGVQYVLALEDLGLGPAVPLNQLDDSQATWQVAEGGRLVAVDPANDLGITSLDQLVKIAAQRVASADRRPGTS